MNTKQHCWEDETFPSLLPELSEWEIVGGQMFSLPLKEEGWGNAGGVQRRVTSHPTASEERTSTLSCGEK